MAVPNDACIDRQKIFEHCARNHPGISVVGDGLDSVPHLHGTTITVARVLERLYVHGSIAAVTNYYLDVDEDQVREAVLYAITFVDMACS